MFYLKLLCLFASWSILSLRRTLDMSLSSIMLRKPFYLASIHQLVDRWILCITLYSQMLLFSSQSQTMLTKPLLALLEPLAVVLSLDLLSIIWLSVSFVAMQLIFQMLFLVLWSLIDQLTLEAHSRQQLETHFWILHWSLSISLAFLTISLRPSLLVVPFPFVAFIGAIFQFSCIFSSVFSTLSWLRSLHCHFNHDLSPIAHEFSFMGTTLNSEQGLCWNLSKPSHSQQIQVSSTVSFQAHQLWSAHAFQIHHLICTKVMIPGM